MNGVPNIFLGLVVLMAVLMLLVLAKATWNERKILKERKYAQLVQEAECHKYSESDVKATQSLYQAFQDQDYTHLPERASEGRTEAWKPDNLEELFERQNPTPKRRAEDWDPNVPGAL